SVDGTAIAGTAPCVEQSPGAATFTFNAPAQVGDYTVRAVELGGQQRTATASLTVAAAAPAPEAPEAPGGTLPRTGAEIARIATIAAAALALGFGAVSLARRRRVATQHAHPGVPDTG
ncbi:MAG: LPXTG cell wall anchor domain-containing protein, partial [Acidimicrobiales bacterium]